jgi:ferredoxin
MQKNLIPVSFLAILLLQFLTGCDNAEDSSDEGSISPSELSADISDITDGKLTVNLAACIGCGRCTKVDPEHFAYDTENLKSSVISSDNLESPELQNAIDGCPAGAIRI